MPTFETALFASQKESRANTSRLGTANLADGNVEFATVSYTLAGGEAANDIINLTVLPNSVIPIPQLSSVTSSDPGTTLTLDVGTAADPDGWFDGVTLSSGGQIAATSGTLPAWVQPTALVADTGSGNAAVYATVASATSLTANVVLTFVLAYKRNK